ncbi:MAG: hypothetical protein OXG44_12665 [Gammaproteobacteria bacterium]|nr:hypothetical protein [Gammaproteobacteria bacterium]
MTPIPHAAELWLDPDNDNSPADSFRGVLIRPGDIDEILAQFHWFNGLSYGSEHNPDLRTIWIYAVGSDGGSTDRLIAAVTYRPELDQLPPEASIQ